MKSPQLYGLVVCGGKSSRMGMDKSLINYHGQPQRYHLFDLLKPFCADVFISCNAIQMDTIPPAYNPLPDDPTLGDIGPMAALITAFRHQPDASFLVIGCDYPLVQKADIEKLVSAHTEKDRTVCYINQDGFIEPLLALYTFEMKGYLEKHLAAGQHSLRKCLELANAHTIAPANSTVLLSADDPAASEQVKEFLRSLDH